MNGLIIYLSEGPLLFLEEEGHLSWMSGRGLVEGGGHVQVLLSGAPAAPQQREVARERPGIK